VERKYLRDGKRALDVLGCTAVESLKVGQDHHLTALQPNGSRIYLRELAELERAILALSRGERDK
jgi:hypothetical protein